MLAQGPDLFGSRMMADIALIDGDHRISPDGRHAVIRRKGEATFEVLLIDGVASDAPLAALIPLDADAPSRIAAITRLLRSLEGRPVSPDTRLTKQKRRRLKLMMQAADGRSQRASYREIASTLFGADRVAAEHWKTSALRDSAISLVEGANSLIRGGYLQLLRHRRRASSAA